MAKLIQNFFGMPENILMNSLFTRVPTWGGSTTTLKNLDTTHKKFLLNYEIAIVRGIGNLAITVTPNSIRIKGTIVATGEIPCIDMFYSDQEFWGSSSSMSLQKPVTMGGSVADNKGNLAYNLGAAFVCTSGLSAGNWNYYYRNEAKPVLNKKRSSLAIFVPPSQFKPYWRLALYKAEPNQTVEVDYTISDLFVYDGAYINSKYVPDVVSSVGVNKNSPLSYPHGFMMAENLPIHAREYVMEGQKIYDFFYKTNLTAPYGSIYTGYKWAPGYPSYLCKRGTLYAYPSNGNDSSAILKYDISQIYHTTGTTWTAIEETITEDTSYRKLLRSLQTTSLPKIVVTHYFTSRGDCYSMVKFYRTNDNSGNPPYSTWKFKFIWNIDSQTSYTYSDWESFNEFNPVRYSL